jgi:hypothetical protein
MPLTCQPNAVTTTPTEVTIYALVKKQPNAIRRKEQSKNKNEKEPASL